MRIEAITTLTPAQQAAVADFVANRAPHIPGLARWRVVRQFQSREVELLYTVGQGPGALTGGWRLANDGHSYPIAQGQRWHDGDDPDVVEIDVSPLRPAVTVNVVTALAGAPVRALSDARAAGDATAPPRPARPRAWAPWRSQLTIAWLAVLNGLAIGNWLLGGDELNGVISYAQMDAFGRGVLLAYGLVAGGGCITLIYSLMPPHAKESIRRAVGRWVSIVILAALLCGMLFPGLPRAVGWITLEVALIGTIVGLRHPRS